MITTLERLKAQHEPAPLPEKMAAIAMSAVAAIGLLTRPPGRIGGVMNWPELALVAVYLLNSYALCFHGG